MQSVIIYILLGAAVAYIARKVYQAFSHKGGAGCAHCDPSDINTLKKTAHGK
jgi:hypothetical protein